MRKLSCKGCGRDSQLSPGFHFLFFPLISASPLLSAMSFHFLVSLPVTRGHVAWFCLVGEEWKWHLQFRAMSLSRGWCSLCPLLSPVWSADIAAAGQLWPWAACKSGSYRETTQRVPGLWTDLREKLCACPKSTLNRVHGCSSIFTKPPWLTKSQPFCSCNPQNPKIISLWLFEAHVCGYLLEKQEKIV